jgi:hypothetical protein
MPSSLLAFPPHPALIHQSNFVVPMVGQFGEAIATRLRALAFDFSFFPNDALKPLDIHASTRADIPRG